MAVTSGEQLPGADRNSLVAEALRQEITNLARRVQKAEARVEVLESTVTRQGQRIAQSEGRGFPV